MIMASDMIADMRPTRVEDNNISVSVHPDSRQEADRSSMRSGSAARSRCPSQTSSGTTTLAV
jgi:hypothetical protein